MANALAVWTGSTVLFWNNIAGFSFDPVANRFDENAAITGGPSLYYGATATWTGQEMILWGESTNGDAQLAGAAYNPATGEWRDILVPETAETAARSNHAAVWTGSEMIIWGGDWGDANVQEESGWRYTPGADTIVAVTSTNAPSPRSYPQALWTGSEMIVWGGSAQGEVLTDGGIYNPAANTWRELPALPEGYAAGRHAKAVWTGEEMIVWNGGISRDGQIRNDQRREQTLYRFNPVSNTWQASAAGWAPFTVTTNGTSLYEDGHFVTWTGDRLLVVPRSSYDPAYLYDPLTDCWQAVVTTEDFRTDKAATVWAGDRLVQWGGGVGLVFTDNDGVILTF